MSFRARICRQTRGQYRRKRPLDAADADARIHIRAWQVLVFVFLAKVGASGRGVGEPIATRNQVQIPTSGSPLPLWERARG